LVGAKTLQEAGTTIEITKINSDIQSLFGDTTIETSLHRAIGQTYGPFLASFVDIILNGVQITPSPIPLGKTKDMKTAVDSWTEDGVKITLIAGPVANWSSRK
jgi:hypothetical protein